MFSVASRDNQNCPIRYLPEVNNVFTGSKWPDAKNIKKQIFTGKTVLLNYTTVYFSLTALVCF